MDEMKKRLNITEDKPTDWFETLYDNANEEGVGVPWANMAPHPVFKSWIDDQQLNGKGKKALVVGCGLGDDAIELESRGFEVTAFDVSHHAISLCKRRFPDANVHFIQADLLLSSNGWKGQFDFVLEIFTIQALPPKYEALLIKNIASFVANNGQLLVVTEVQKTKRSFEVGPPWLLNTDYIQSFEKQDLKKSFFSNDFPPAMGEEIHLTLFERHSSD